MGSVDTGRRRFLKALIYLAGASVLAGMLRWLSVLTPPLVGVTAFPRLLLVNEKGEPVKASQVPVNGQEIAIFNYPLGNEPNILLNLGDSSGRPVEIPPTTVVVPQTGATYEFPGGVGAYRSIVAFSAVCQHLGCTFPSLTFYPPGIRVTTLRGPMDKVIYCSCHGSVYDPYRGGAVVVGPSTRPLPAVVLEWDPVTDELHAVKMIGPVIYGHPGFDTPTQDVVNNPVGDLQGGPPISGNTTTVYMYRNPALSR